jgi:hypothetical protein
MHLTHLLREGVANALNTLGDLAAVINDDPEIKTDEERIAALRPVFAVVGIDIRLKGQS